ncbi:transcription attenuator LytR [Oscillochloris trichoides DG-6]|uniref:Transcription attenuator LytR n=1 Tax=Oscillochloris trichoides DG-6 TaxID=765420 RepID=E1IG39_9CHLR|nr:LCP family protein [Oscillochloris trichoides]EFO79837.1 transcription attenuator LytR [Oscillochloris trichoides DG-6]
MSLLRRRPLLGAFILISLLATTALLRVGLEWRQALHDIDSMIVTPAVIPLPTDTLTSHEQVSGPPSAPVSNSSNQTVAHTEDLPSLSQQTVNILLLGTDARPTDTEPTRTDAIVVVRLDRDSGRVSMLSIPRDLWVSYPNGGEGRINAAYAVGEKKYGPGGGAALAKSTVGKLIGVKIDQFVLINFEGFKTLIDRLGGINVDVPVAINDPAYPTDDYGTISVTFAAGPQMMDGERALIYARTRHADNDFGRNQRQQLVLMSIFNRILDRGLLEQLTSVDDYTGALRGYVQTDMSRSTMLALVGFARDVDISNVLRYAIDSTTIVELNPPATFAAEPRSLRRIVAQFTGDAISTAGGE